MAKRAKGLTRPESRTAKQSVRTLSSEDANAVGRPGFRGKVAATPEDGKAPVTRVRQIDPARGITQPGADVITTTHIDLVGPQNPTIVNVEKSPAPSKGKKVIRPPRQSPPVASSRQGKVTRPGSQ